ncbi:IQ domain-containing protein E isoform X2 [Motacilla alba alba]|uniref:IQ domain-containing protein E isoform X2 n=1 Tax=Motacilla alba alba TaxID=1094192 RepID=UPI0018D556AA|nr:IQ domain-containing protein E isoform X2 [Motacilla alba alba]XP_038007276.1 IQ domain-containing protein E isoform X2 [Motacilla alba alba]
MELRPARSYPGALGQKLSARKWSGALAEPAPPPAGVSLPAGPLGVTRAPPPGRALPRHRLQACPRSAHASPPRAAEGCHGYREPEVPPGGDGCPQPRAGGHGPRAAPRPRRLVRPSRCSPTMARGAGEAAAEGELGDDSLSVITCQSDTAVKLKKKIFQKPPKSPKSPYSSSTQLYPKKAAAWRSLQGRASACFENAAVENPRQMWLGFLKQGMSHALKSDADTGHVRANVSSSTPEYLKEALGMKKPKHARSSSNGYIPGTPDYKEKEDMYDEIIELKKTIQAQKNLGDRMKTKLRRLEEENNRKDKQIEQLLDPSRGSELARASSEKKTDNGWVVTGLKQKIVKLEEQCKEKDNTINEFQADMKTSSLEEVRLAMETYYEEVHRLQLLLAKSETMRKNAEGRDTQKRLKALNAAVLRLSRNIREMQAENRRLKEDLDHVLSTSPPHSKTKNYSEWSRQRLVRKILDLEKKVCAMESSRVSLGDSEASQVLAESSSHSVDLDHPTSQHLECCRLQRLVKKLKDDRQALQNLLLSKELDIKQLLQAKAEVELELQKWQSKMEEKSTGEQTLSEEIQNLTQKVGKLELKLEEEKRQMGEDTVEKLNKTPPVCTVTGKENHRKEQAARIIQRCWKMYKTKKEEVALHEAVVLLQAAFRGHLSRQKGLLDAGVPDAKSLTENSCLSSMSDSLSFSSDCKERDEMVTFIQSIFRAHLARTESLQERPSVPSAPSEKADPAVAITEKRPGSAALQGSSVPTSPLPGRSCSAPGVALDEAHSDDSDDVVVPPLLQVKKSYTHF